MACGRKILACGVEPRNRAWLLSRDKTRDAIASSRREIGSGTTSSRPFPEPADHTRGFKRSVASSGKRMMTADLRLCANDRQPPVNLLSNGPRPRSVAPTAEKTPSPEPSPATA